jgi:hypothetical protein
VHRAVGESFIYLHEDWLRAWLMAKNKGIKAMTCPQFSISRFDTIREIWMTAVTRHKAS